ncbi:PDZ domain-containing protein [Bythopirellula goksoeyrii]|uniref:Serine protease Do-like HtrA n=1 Tax=Bythopirellula goksoeyrii TaxID=1400387 RepID=A0A5B9Q814_9BACT|nr:PDZ domain-containing protein [Bythopirellula goksoeyrii]QEG35128.1 Serine protease Do-like HtrA [Bythopirellula goksoeyrii]
MKRTALYISSLFCFLILPCSAEQDDINRPALGMTVVDIPQDPDLIRLFTKALKSPTQMHWPGRQGAVVVNVLDGSNAAAEKIRIGDLIVQIGKVKIKSATDVNSSLKKVKVGDEIRLVFRYPEFSGGRIKWVLKGVEITVQSYLELIKKQLVTSNDKLSGLRYTSHKDADQGLTTNRVSLKLASKEGIQIPVIKVMYRGDTWLFVDSLTFLVDGKKIEVDPEYSEFTRENTHEFCWEWVNLVGNPDSPTDSIWEICKLLQDCESASIFYHGKKFREEHELSHTELSEIKVLLEYLQYQRGN